MGLGGLRGYYMVLEVLRKFLLFALGVEVSIKGSGNHSHWDEAKTHNNFWLGSIIIKGCSNKTA